MVHNINSILRHPVLRKDFIIFCYIHENKENILFIDDIHKFKQLTCEKERIMKYLSIIDIYFTKDAYFPLNLNEKIVYPILYPSSFDNRIFDQAYREIIKLIQESILPDYIKELSLKETHVVKQKVSLFNMIRNILSSKTNTLKRSTSLYEFSDDLKINEIKDKIKKSSSLYNNLDY